MSSLTLQQNKTPSRWTRFCLELENKLFELNLAAGGFDRCFELLGVLLLHALLEHGRSCVDEVLRLLKPEAECVLDRLDDLDLRCACVGELGVEGGLLLCRLASRCRARDRDRCRAHAPVRLERLHELVELEDRHLLDGCDDVLELRRHLSLCLCRGCRCRSLYCSCFVCHIFITYSPFSAFALS